MRNIERYHRNIKRLNRGKPFAKIGSEVRNRLHKRTVKGLDSTDTAMPALSNIYQTYKIEANRPGIRNISFSGATLEAMQAKKVSGGFDLYFNNEDAEAIAAAHHYGTDQVKTGFFQLGKKLEDYIVKELTKEMRK